MRLYSPVDLTGNVNMIEKLVLGGTGTGDLSILIPQPDALTSAPSSQLCRLLTYWHTCEYSLVIYLSTLVR